MPDLDLRMGLYRRLNELEDRHEIEAFAAELIDRFGKLPPETANLLKIIEIKLNCRSRRWSPSSTSARRARWSASTTTASPTSPGLLAYVERLKGTAKLRPDSKLVITRDWPDAEARLNGALQLSKGLAKLLS